MSDLRSYQNCRIPCACARLVAHTDGGACVCSAFWVLFYVMEAGAIMTILTQHGGDKKAAVRPTRLGNRLPMCKPGSRASVCKRVATVTQVCCLLIHRLDWLQGKAIAQLRTLPQMLLPSTFPLVKQLVKTSRRIQVDKHC